MKRVCLIRARRVLLWALAVGALLGSLLIGTIIGSRYGVPLVRQYQDWSIGVLKGESPFRLEPSSDGWNPVLSASDVTDIDALFVADPFLLELDDRFVMFFEAFNRSDGQGDIAMATSEDGTEWRYGGIVLDEAFHLSYPYVFPWAGETYMVPESCDALGVFLYRATEFPAEWVNVRQLLRGQYVDPSLVYHEGRWWLFVGEIGNAILRLFSAPSLEDRFVEHPLSPLIVGDTSSARPGGRVLKHESQLFRVAQDDSADYGVEISLFEIVEMSPETYVEMRIPETAFGARGRWNASGIHHLDALKLGPDRWLAAIDGWSRRRLAFGL